MDKVVNLSSIISEMLKAMGKEGVELARELAEAIFSNGAIPRDWEKSTSWTFAKARVMPCTVGNYWGLKLADQMMKLLKRLLDTHIRHMVDIYAMQFHFVPVRGTTDAMFIVC